MPTRREALWCSRLRAFPAESLGRSTRVCTRNLGGIAEVQLGHQAIVLTRSRLYGALALSPSNIFLALAAEIPDPAHPEALISNPNTTWDRVNGAFNNEPIEVFGPPAQSTTGIAFREILFEAGCNSFPTIAALKQTDAARYERVCSTFRKDGAYVEMPEQVPFDIFQTLQKHSSRPLTWAPPTSPKSAKCRAPRRITSNALNDC